MSPRAVIEQHINVIAKEQEKNLPPLRDDLVLLDSGLDSLCFALLVARLEDDLGVDPFLTDDEVHFPVTFGELVEFYDRALR